MPRRHLNGHSIVHLIQTAIDGRPIFERPGNKGHLLRLLREGTRKHPVDLYAFAVMRTHYHLIVRADAKSVSAFMHDVNRRYSLVYNRNHHRVGPLFKGPFSSHPIFTLEYAADRSFYIHLNPVDAGLVRLPEHYRWSSAAGYLGPAAPPTWLNPAPILSLFSRIRDQARAKYADALRAFQKSRAQEGPIDAQDFALLAS